MTTVSHEVTESHHLPPELVAKQQRQAVLYIILADAVLFGCLLFTYFYLRSLNVEGGWIPDGGRTASAALVWTIAAVTLISAAVYWGAETALASDRRQRFQAMTLLGLLLLLVVVGLSIYQLLTVPLLMSDGSYASTFLLMAGVQLLHVLILIVVAFGIWNRAVRGRLDGGNTNHATLVGYFWYWVTLTALLAAMTTFFV